ncbi:MAG: hypothetical protein CVT98_04475, partial [Bacteroidetes bacterium HGW-Bacteroidetes-15]
MIKQWLFSAIIALGFSVSSFGQEYRVYGTISDTLTQQNLEGVVIEAISSTQHYSAFSNFKGQYSLTLPEGNYKIGLSIIGYSSYSENIDIESDTQLDFYLTSQPISLGEIVVSSFRVDRKLKELPTSMA